MSIKDGEVAFYMYAREEWRVWRKVKLFFAVDGNVQSFGIDFQSRCQPMPVSGNASEDPAPH